MKMIYHGSLNKFAMHCSGISTSSF